MSRIQGSTMKKTAENFSMRFVKERMLGGVKSLVVRCTFRSLGRFGNVDNRLCAPQRRRRSIGPHNGARIRATFRKVLPQLLRIIGRVSKNTSQLYVHRNVCS
jgi:hypothetical protein